MKALDSLQMFAGRGACAPPESWTFQNEYPGGAPNWRPETEGGFQGT